MMKAGQGQEGGREQCMCRGGRQVGRAGAPPRDEVRIDKMGRDGEEWGERAGISTGDTHTLAGLLHQTDDSWALEGGAHIEGLRLEK